MAGILFALDLRMIRDRIADSAGQIGSRLYSIVEREQLLNDRKRLKDRVAKLEAALSDTAKQVLRRMKLEQNWIMKRLAARRAGTELDNRAWSR